MTTGSKKATATLTVRHLDAELVRRLLVRAAEHGRSAEDEHCEILRAALAGPAPPPHRQEAAARLAAFRARTAGRGSASAADLIDESRSQRLRVLLGGDNAV